MGFWPEPFVSLSLHLKSQEYFAIILDLFMFLDVDEDGEKITVRSDDELMAMFQMVYPTKSYSLIHYCIV